MLDEKQANDPKMAETVRALFIISPDKRLRLSMYYPTSTGRNVELVFIYYHFFFVNLHFSLQ